MTGVLRAAVCSMLALAAGCGPAETSPPTDPSPPAATAQESHESRAVMQRGIDWLLKQQSDDGRWHSATYGQMRGGAGNTALAVYALALAGASSPRERAAIDRGLAFLLKDLDPQGFVRGSEGQSDYPAYATALTLLTIAELESDGYAAKRTKMQAYLNGVLRGLVAADGDALARRQVEQDANVSVVRWALASLQRKNALADDAKQTAVSFLQRCQDYGSGETHSGGFWFATSAYDPRNKAGRITDEEGITRARPYGSATADGILALTAAGFPSDDARMSAAMSWLQGHPAVDPVPGFADDDGAVQTARSVRYYYCITLAEVIAASSQDRDWSRHRAALVAFLAASQRADGSWANEVPLMQENDPLIATSLAVAALALVLPTADNADAFSASRVEDAIRAGR